MGRVYNVIDADGHILEPLDLWENYIDPAFRDRAPRIVKGDNGKERLVIEEQAVGDGQRGIGRIGAVGARQGVVEADTMAYKDGKPGGFDPHKRIPDMDADGIDAVYYIAQKNYPIEFAEHNYPLRVRQYAINRDSGGPGSSARRRQRRS